MASVHAGRPYRRLRDWTFAHRPPVCIRCGGGIDMRLRTVDPRHPLAPSLDHAVPQARGGAALTQDNAWISHYGCNAAYRDGGRTIKVRTTQREPKRGLHGASRAW